MGCFVQNIAAQSIPCLEIGGDFYDVIESHGCLYVIIADISGKGISAALLASTLQGMLYALVQANLPLPEIAAVANQFIFNKNVGKYATMVMVRITADGVAEYMNCGHIKPLVVSDTSVLQLQDSNMVVGLLPNIAYESTTHQLKKGERIILVTDGVTEAENEAGDFYGDDALAAAVLLPTVDQILAEVQGFMGSAPSADDCTIVELRYSGNNVVAT
jgi:sigma-B regulation protein RsbU (phosphoserine phosphatase)